LSLEQARADSRWQRRWSRGELRRLWWDRQAAGANTSRAAVVNARTLEVLDDLDMPRRLVKQGMPAPRCTNATGAAS